MTSLPSDPLLAGLRPARTTDADALIELIGGAYAEYPGCVLDLPDLDADLLDPQAAAASTGGRWWVLPERDRVIATIAAGPVRAAGQLELKRLYLAPDARGRGLATALVARVEAHAAGRGAVAVDLWSDSRFAPAHHRYRQLGYVATGERRHLDDPSGTTEYRFLKVLDPPTAP